MEEKYNKQLQEARGKFLVFLQDEVTLPNGKTAVREMVLHPGAVAVLAVTENEEIIFVKQYRYPVREVLFEIPAGKLEGKEDPFFSAQRELEEETGFQALQWEKLGTFYSTPGFSNEIMHLYLAQDLVQKTAHPDPDEIIEYQGIPFDQALRMVSQGEIKDAKTVIGILWLAARKKLTVD